MWTSDGVNFYFGDCKPGDRAATAAEIATFQASQSIAAIEAAVQLAIDQKAQAKGYADAATCISYMNSSNATWKADATALNAWRDAVWTYTFAQEALTPLPTAAAVVAALPTATTEPW